MGGVQSHFSDTDWEKADGGLKEASETFDGAEPTKAHSIFYLMKKNIVKHRDCEIIDEDKKVVYLTTSVEGTTKDFDLLNPMDGTMLFHVHTDASHSNWEIYSYKPNFEGQTPKDDNGVKVDVPLYYKAKVAIAWDKYHGVISMYEPNLLENTQGVLSNEHILRIEEIKSITAQFQTFVPAMTLVHPKLCGYWIREHTAKTDRVKMHLAKGTDVALHCILAVIANLVQLDRQAEQS